MDARVRGRMNAEGAALASHDNIVRMIRSVGSGVDAIDDNMEVTCGDIRTTCSNLAVQTNKKLITYLRLVSVRNFEL